MSIDMKLCLAVFLFLTIIYVDAKKISGSRSSSGSGRGSSRRTSYKPQPAPTPFSYPQPSAPKPTLFGWQESAKKTQTLSSWQSKPSSGQSHSYPSSQTGLSGSNQPKQPPKYPDSIQKNSAPQNWPAQQSQTGNDNQPSYTYPSSNGLSGNSGSSYPSQSVSGQTQKQGHNYPQTQGSRYPQPNGGSYPQQGTGLSGAGRPPPPYPGGAPAPYPGGVPHSNPGNIASGSSYQTNNYGNQYQQPQGVGGGPPPYSFGSNYGGPGGHGGFGGHGYNPGYSPQMPGYFGNYGNAGKGFGGVSRTGSALTGIGIAGAGVGTILTGLALWNLARSTGHHQHTVIYDNRGHPVAVAPSNDTVPLAIDPILADLINCTLTISTNNATEILEIPCAIATSFTPEADVKNFDSNNNNSKDNTKCTVGVVTKSGKEYTTTIPCSTLLKTAAENNVTEPPLLDNINENANLTVESVPVDLTIGPPTALKRTGSSSEESHNLTMVCVPQPGVNPDPINPCFSVTHNLTVIPLPLTTSTNLPERK